MSIRNLDRLFTPKSIAVIGASDRPYSIGATVMNNLIGGTFAGPIWPVNNHRSTVAGRPAYASVAALPSVADLAVICTPPPTIPGLIAELGAAGTRAAIVITAGLSSAKMPDGRTVAEAMLATARPHLLRVLGPNCVGLLVPRIGMNASFAHTDAATGSIAMVAQSGALVTAMLDWAKTRGIGFSKFVSLGDAADVDFGDVLDYLAGDAGTRAILLYIESITAPRKFMSAARAAARNKPVIVVKAGRAPEAAKAAASHTGALAGADDVYDAAIRRAGLLRVKSTRDLLDAAETLMHSKPMHGERLAILTNGGGPGVMATDALIERRGTLATLSAETIAALNAVLPPTWSRGNPIDIIGDAPPERYVDALRVLLQAPEVDALLFIHAPTAIVPSAEIAKSCAPLVRHASRNVLASWMGGDGVRDADDIFHAAGVPTYETPEEAVAAFEQLTEFRRNQALLMQTPASIAGDVVADSAGARRVIGAALESGRTLLTEPESKQVLAAYGIPVVRTETASNAAEAADVATAIGFPVALKILSPDISHKSDVGGVALNLASREAVMDAATTMRVRCAQLRPDARLTGFTVQQMIRRGGAHELIVGCTTDRVFGPVILFGQGGTAVEAVADRAVGLPPLNLSLARDLVGRTRIAKLLAGYRDRPPADMDAILRTLVGVSRMVADLPEIAELDINPLLADDAGVIALDARVRVERPRVPGTERFVIRPYPKELEETVALNGRPVLLRPIRPEDEPLHARFLEAIDPQDLHLRFFRVVRRFEHSQLARFTQIDYDREMAFIAVAPIDDASSADGPREQTLGVVRAVADADRARAEYAILVRSDMKGRGLGSLLMRKLIDYCRQSGIGELVGEVLAENAPMRALARDLGFTEATTPEDPAVVQTRLVL